MGDILATLGVHLQDMQVLQFTWFHGKVRKMQTMFDSRGNKYRSFEIAVKTKKHEWPLTIFFY